MNRRHGIALILVLWVLVLLTALLSSFAIVARSEALMARQLRDATRATYAAQAGVEMALLRVADTDPDWRWVPDGRPYEAEFDGARLQVEVLDETAKLDLNLADPAALTRFFLGIGLNEDEAMRAADVIVDFRDADDLTQPMGAEADDYRAAGLPYGPKDAPFERVEELQQVLGMTPELFQRAAPHLTVHTGTMPNPAYASAPVLAALGFDPVEVEGMVEERAALGELSQGLPGVPDPGGFMVGGGSGTYSIRSVAWLPDGAEAELNVTLRVAPAGVPGPAFVLLSRHEGEAYQ